MTVPGLFPSEMPPEVFQETPELCYANVNEFVTEFLLPSWRHTFAGARWCSQWWRHSEAISRLDALWRAFEQLRTGEPLNMAVWWRDYADPMMRSLTDPDGVFCMCDATTDEHRVPEVWKSDPPPEGMFTDERKIETDPFLS